MLIKNVFLKFENIPNTATYTVSIYTSLIASILSLSFCYVITFNDKKKNITFQMEKPT